MPQIKAYLAATAKAPLQQGTITRRDPLPHDVVIKIEYCGVCHSDVHQARGEWGANIFPMVPGHEIVGTVLHVGQQVKNFRVGDTVGVGCLVDSCHQCHACSDHTEQYCENGMILTYNSYEKDGVTPTYGGYSQQIIVDEKFVLRIPKNLPKDKTAPLLCAGITTYSPLRHWKINKHSKVAVVGLGGLGHMAVKLAVAMGAEVTVISSSPKKEQDARLFGAKHFICSKQKEAFSQYTNYFDFILNTVSAPINFADYLQLLKLDGTMTCVGVPEQELSLSVPLLIGKRRRLAGSLIGGIKETQEMLDFCATHEILPEIEVIKINDINAAYERMINSDVRYRFVIDMASLA